MTEYRVGIYIRLSLADEDTGSRKMESDSVGNQRELIHQFLDRHGVLSHGDRDRLEVPGCVRYAGQSRLTLTVKRMPEEVWQKRLPPASAKNLVLS